MIIVMLGVAFFAPDVIEEMLNAIKESGNHYGMGKLASYITAGLFGFIGVSMVSYIAKLGFPKFRIRLLKEVNIADKATVADQKDESGC